MTAPEPVAHAVVAMDMTVSFEAHQLGRTANGTVLINQIGARDNEWRITNNFDENHLVVLIPTGRRQPNPAQRARPRRRLEGPLRHPRRHRHRLLRPRGSLVHAQPGVHPERR